MANEKPIAWDITLCSNLMCPNKCKRFKDNWTPDYMQSYTFPTIELDEKGNLKKCELRMDN